MSNLPIGDGDAYTTFCTAGTIALTIGLATIACAWTVGPDFDTTALNPLTESAV